jgi:hypothetical protein
MIHEEENEEERVEDTPDISNCVKNLIVTSSMRDYLISSSNLYAKPSRWKINLIQDDNVALKFMANTGLNRVLKRIYTVFSLHNILFEIE